MKRIYQIVITLCLPLILCNTVQAQHTGPYVGAFAGGNLLTSAKSSDGQGTFNLEFKPGLMGSAVVGLDFEPGNPVGEGRVELEYSRRSNKLDQVGFVEGKVKGSGNLTADSLLINCFAVFSNKTFLAPYVGLGAGVVRIEADNLQVSGQALSKDSVVVFAYQLGAGLDFPLNDYLSLDLGYRFFSTTRPKFKEPDGSSFKSDYFNHSAIFGIRIGF